MKWQRRGDFHADFRALVANHRFPDEIKWSTASRHQYRAFYEELVEYFFRHPWLVFHCLVVRKAAVNVSQHHDDDWDLARRKHFTMLLTNKMKKALKRFPDREHEFRVWCDPIASKYEKADEAVEIISNRTLNQEFRTVAPVTSVITRDSKDTPAIQLCDILLGAVMETWQRKAQNKTKLAIRSEIARHLGWDNLDSDTRPSERKFNVWYFFDPIRERRDIKTRTVRLLYPYPGPAS